MNFIDSLMKGFLMFHHPERTPRRFGRAASLTLLAVALATAPSGFAAKSPPPPAKKVAVPVAAPVAVPVPVVPEEAEPSVDPLDRERHNVRILRTTNKAQLNKYVPVVYAFNYVNPYAVIRFLRRPVTMEEGVLFTFVAPDGKSGRVLLGIPEYQVPYYDSLVRSIDRPGLNSSDGTTRVYRRLKHRRANINLANPTLDDITFVNQAQGYLTANGSTVIVDPEQNALFYEDTPSGADNLTHALEEFLDQPTPQAEVTVKVYELLSENNSRIGLDYAAWKNGPGSSLFAAGGFSEAGRATLRSGSGRTLYGINGLNNLPLPRSTFRTEGWNVAYRYEVSSAFFDYLATEGKAKLLNSSRVSILNSRTARVAAGDQILYYAVETTDPSGVRVVQPLPLTAQRVVIPGPIATPTATRADNANLKDPAFIQTQTFIQTAVSEPKTILVSASTGVELEINSLISQTGADLKVNGWVSDFNGFDDTGTPRINSRRFASAIRLREGEETIIGGLVHETELKAANKPPILGSLPVIGYLFGGEAGRKTRSEVVIAIQLERIERFPSEGGAHKTTGVTPADQAVIHEATGGPRPVVVQEPAAAVEPASQPLPIK